MERTGRIAGSQTELGAERAPRTLGSTVAALAFFAAPALASLLTVEPVSAVPSFARQTGQPC
ncbi:MAG: hypothetical protein ACLPSW_04235 [Roseiarcus sp.]